jgi:hypothetical protein
VLRGSDAIAAEPEERIAEPEVRNHLPRARVSEEPCALRASSALSCGNHDRRARTEGTRRRAAPLTSPFGALDERDELVTWARVALAAARRVAAKRERTSPRRIKAATHNVAGLNSSPNKGMPKAKRGS